MEVRTVTDPHFDPNTHQEDENDSRPAARERKSGRTTRVQKRWLFFGALAVIFVLAYCLVNMAQLEAFFTFVGGVLSPLFIGCIIAYLLNPLLKFYEYFVFRKLKRKSKLRLVLSLLCTFLTALGILALLVALVLPELYRSIKDLVENYQTYLNGLLSHIQTLIDRMHLDVDISDMEKLTAWITDLFGSAEAAMEELLNTLRSLVTDSDLIVNLWAFIMKLFGSIVDVALGIFIAFYILSSKEKRMAQLSKFRAAYLNDKHEDKLTEIVELVDKTFGGFFKGVLVDALAVGIMMYIALSVCRISEYNLLIATICALTNIIPVFGPIIGAVPSGIIILITNPEKLIWFIIIVLVIQQLDGNILVPLIQGNSTGISSLAVLVSITVMGGLFKIPGMILGVPIFAVIIELGKRAIEEKLRAQGKETDTTHYYRKSAVGNAEEEVYYEHAHWKYKYDHSKIKPHVDKLLAALARKKNTAKTAPIPTDEVAVDAPSADDPTPMAAVTADTAAEDTESDTESE